MRGCATLEIDSLRIYSTSIALAANHYISITYVIDNVVNGVC